MKPKQEDPKEMVGGCCVCSDENGWAENPLVYCDGQGCNVAVHQACYGIVTVPTGAWFCRKCESQERAARVRCELCPSKDGALKRTDSGGWAHVVCALYIPEVRFGNVTTMEPIMLQLVPQERFNKSCYLCDESSRGSKATIGACMQCNRAGCKNHFHVTCAQAMGLLCEEAGNYMDNVKYCGYCQYHYNKLRRGSHVKTIPPYRPVPHDTLSSDEDKASSSGDFKDLKLKKRPHKSSPVHDSTKQLGREVKIALDELSGPSKSGINTSVSSSVCDSSEDPSVSSEFSVSLVHSSGLSVKSEPKSSVNLQPSSLSVLNVAPLTLASTSVKQSPNSSGASDSKTSSVTTVTFPTSSLSLMSVSLPSSTPAPVSAAEPSTTGSLTITAQSSAVLPTAPTTITAVTTSPFPTSVPVTREAVSSAISSSVSTTVSAAPKMKPINVTSSAEPVNVSSHATLSVSLSNSNSAEKEKEKQRKIRRSLPRSGGGSNASDGAINAIEAMDHSSKDGGLTLSEEKNLSSDKDTKGSAKGHHSSPDGGKLNVQFTPNVSSQSHKTDSFHAFNSEVILAEPVKRSRSSSQDRGRRSKRGASSSGSGGSIPKRGRASLASRETSKEAREGSRDSSPDTPSVTDSAAPKRSRATIKADPKDSKESLSSVITNGLGVNTLLLGNQINPASAVAQKMTDTLHAELEAHSIYKEEEKVNTSLMGPALPGKKETSTPGGGLSTGQPPPLPQSLEQLLERQWEQGSQFLMEQAQHFDIASLLSCLHQLRQENVRLEETVTSLVARRDHLLAVNARLSVPLSATQSSNAGSTSQAPAPTPSSTSTPTTPSAPATTASLVTVTHSNPSAIVGAHLPTQATGPGLNPVSRTHVQQRHPSGGSSHAPIPNPPSNMIGRGASPHDRRAPHQGPPIENGLGEPEYRYRSPSNDHQHRQQSPMLPPGAQPSPTLRQSPASSSYHSGSSPHSHTGVPQLSPSGVGSVPHALVTHSGGGGGAAISMSRGPAEPHSRADLVRHSNPGPGVGYPVYQMVSPPIPGPHHSPVGMAQHPPHSQVMRREVVESSRGSHQIEKR